MSDQRRNTFKTPRTTFRQRTSKRMRGKVYTEETVQHRDLAKSTSADPAVDGDSDPGENMQDPTFDGDGSPSDL